MDPMAFCKRRTCRGGASSVYRTFSGRVICCCSRSSWVLTPQAVLDGYNESAGTKSDHLGTTSRWRTIMRLTPGQSTWRLAERRLQVRLLRRRRSRPPAASAFTLLLWAHYRMSSWCKLGKQKQGLEVGSWTMLCKLGETWQTVQMLSYSKLHGTLRSNNPSGMIKSATVQ